MKTIAAFITIMALSVAAPVFAMPVLGTIGSASNFSVIHNGSNPSGIGDGEDWRWFEAGQQINLLLDDGILTLAGDQTFGLNIPSAPEQPAAVTFTGLSLDLNDASDGFAGGHISYTLDGIDGTFNFADDNYGDSPFNSSDWLGNELSVYVWGGDIQNELGIDLALTVTVAEPRVIALLLLGLTGLGLMRRRPLTVRAGC